MSAQSARCPSARCEEGSFLLGVVLPDGTVSLADEPLPVDEHFVAAAMQSGPAPETRFRFSSPCAGASGKQWTGSRCGVIDEVLAVARERSLPPVALRPCAIRSSCRWFSQSGESACGVCVLVVTDTR